MRKAPPQGTLPLWLSACAHILLYSYFNTSTDPFPNVPPTLSSCRFGSSGLRPHLWSWTNEPHRPHQHQVRVGGAEK